jgi:probable blue pigment (indigoidine) exporter
MSGSPAAIETPTPARPVSRWAGWPMAIFSTLCFSLAPPLSKAAIDLGMDSLALLVVRMVLTAIMLGAVIVLTSPRRLRIDRPGLLFCLGAGLANGVGMVMFFRSLDRLDASIASMIFSLSPLVLLLLLALRGEKFTYRNVVRLALGLGGVYLLIGPGGEVDSLGVLLALGTVVTVPIQILFMQWYLQDYDGYAVTFYMVVGMLVVALGWWALQGLPWQPVSLTAWWLLLALVVVSTVIARLTMFVALRGIGGGQLGLLAPLETTLTVLWSVFFLQERLSLLQWAGSGLVILSALLAMQRLKRVRWKPSVAD